MRLTAVFFLACVFGVVGDLHAAGAWTKVVDDVWCSSGSPCAYALVDGDAAIWIGAPRGADLKSLKRNGVKRLELVLLTHHHRDTSAQAASLARAGVSVRAPKAAAPWLTAEGVAQFWRKAVPVPAVGREPDLKERTFNEWVYLVHPLGIDGIDCSLDDGTELRWRSWQLRVVATPGHSRDSLAYVAKRDGGSARVVFCGDAFCAPGRIWSPYTTDWEHWTGDGLKAAAESLERIAGLDPQLVCPEHGPPHSDDVRATLTQTASELLAAAALKSFEDFTKSRTVDLPNYAFLAMRQVATAGDEPWSRLSPNLFLTGNTYALASRDGALLLVDPYGPRIAAQVRALQQERRLGDVERVMISHAHNDHYKGVYLLPERDSFQLWTLAQVAEPIGRPYRYLAPYLDARPVRTDRRLNDGEIVRWREYEFKIHHLPGQTEFTMGVESTIDGKRCFFTADNFFHADQFSGSGGWSGRNRAWPDGYAASARQVLDAAPDWVLAEHGGAFEFNREDFARRVRWAQDAARAADRVSPSGHYRRDWDPQRVRVEPLLVSARPGERIQMAIVAFNPTQIEETLGFELDGRGVLTGTRGEITVTAEGTARREVEVEVLRDAAPGRHVLPLVIRNGEVEDGSDTFFIVDVE